MLSFDFPWYLVYVAVLFQPVLAFVLVLDFVFSIWFSTVLARALKLPLVLTIGLFTYASLLLTVMLYSAANGGGFIPFPGMFLFVLPFGVLAALIGLIIKLISKPAKAV